MDKKTIKLYLLAWWHAFRAFSLIIALASCALGVSLAVRDGYWELIPIILVLLGGLFIQSGVNLINDFFEFKQRNLEDKIPHLRIFGRSRERIEWIIFFSGLGFFALAVPIGLYLVYRTGYPLLILGIIGFLGGYFYTGEPFNYKRRGLGVVFVFFLMGVFMVSGSYYAVSGTLQLSVLWISLPLSSLISLILLSNEIRDYEYDLRHGLKTLVARIGFKGGVILFFLLSLFAYGGAAVLYFTGYFPHLYFIYFSLPFLVNPVRSMLKKEGRRKKIIPDIMLHHLVYSSLFIATYFLP